MTYKFFPHTDDDIRQMLAKIGIGSLEDLYAGLPEEVKFKGEYDMPEAMSEQEVRDVLGKLAQKNTQFTCFAGAGVYDHYTPSVVPNIVERSEFLTSYTPYQAEISQGTLHYIFEFQSMMAEMTGMAISNASMYDGTTATAEAMMMAYANSRKADTVAYSATLDPEDGRRPQNLRPLPRHQAPEDRPEGRRDGQGGPQEPARRGHIAGFIAQQPNYYGVVEDFTGVADACHDKKALFVINSVIADLALMKTPGEWGADVAVGDVQSLGLPMAFGGPYAGYMCCTEKLIRKIPGRIVGKTKDNRGQRAFVLTLHTREQHIRRQKATSNICSNESLMALFATIYCSIMGKEGIKEAAQIGLDGAHTLCEKLVATGKAALVYEQPFFNEFLVRVEDRDAFYDRCLAQGILPGVKVDDDKLLIAVTEKRTLEEIDQLTAILNNK